MANSITVVTEKFVWRFSSVASSIAGQSLNLTELTKDAKTALLSQQFMKGLPSTLHLRLLESDPTPTLTKMMEFVLHFHATRCDGTHDLATVCSPCENNDSPHASLLHSVNQLTADVAALTTNQNQLKAAVKEQH